MLMFNTQRKNSAFLLLVCSLMSLGFWGCSTSEEKQREISINLLKLGNQFYEEYLTNNIVGARQNLLEIVQLSETNINMTPRMQSTFLQNTYFRLYALEARSGNGDMATIYLQKAKYWCIRKQEIEGIEETQIAQTIGKIDTNEIITDYDKWDGYNTKGKGAFYVQQLVNTNMIK